MNPVEAMWRVLAVVGFYGGCLLVAVLGLLVMTAPYWRDRGEAASARRLVERKR